MPQLTSVEIDDELAAMLRDRFADVPSVEIVNADATALAYADGSFTGAACFTMLHHVPTDELQDRLFAEVARVLRPGAALVASDSLGSDELAAHHERRHVQPRRPGLHCRTGWPLRDSHGSTCGPTPTAGRRSRASPDAADERS